MTTTDMPQISAASLFDKPSATPRQNTSSDPLVVIPVTQSSTHSATHQASKGPHTGSSVLSETTPAAQTTQSSSSSLEIATSRTIVVSVTAPVSQQFSTNSVSRQANTTASLLTASGTHLTSTLSEEASSTIVPGSSLTVGQTASTVSSSPQAVKATSSVQSLDPASVQSSTPKATESSKSPFHLTTLSESVSVATASTSLSNKIPTAIVTTSPPATGTVSPAVYAANLAQANGLNTDFADLTASSACNDGQYACIDGDYAGCTSAGTWTVTGCDSGQICAVMPLNTTSGVQIGCFAESKVVSVLGAVPGDSSSAADSTTVSSTIESLPTNTASSEPTASPAVGNGDAGAVTVTVPSSTAYVTFQPSSTSEAQSTSTQSTSTQSTSTQSTSTQSTSTQSTSTQSTSTQSTSTQSTSTQSAEPEAVSTESSTPTEQQQQQHHAGPTTTTALTNLPSLSTDSPTPASPAATDDPLVVIPVTRHSTTTSQLAPAPTPTAADVDSNGNAAGVGFIGAEGGGTSTSTRVDGVTTSIFVTVTAVETVVLRETVTVGLLTTTVSV
ncbi:unnamed protein product [Discula destructiva]